MPPISNNRPNQSTGDKNKDALISHLFIGNGNNEDHETEN
jgi:hypothetical protein